MEEAEEGDQSTGNLHRENETSAEESGLLTTLEKLLYSEQNPGHPLWGLGVNICCSPATLMVWCGMSTWISYKIFKKRRRKKGLIADLIAEKLPEKGQKTELLNGKKPTGYLKLNCDYFIKRLKSGTWSMGGERRPWLQNSVLVLNFGWYSGAVVTDNRVGNSTAAATGWLPFICHLKSWLPRVRASLSVIFMSLETIEASRYRGSLSHLKLKPPLIKKDLDRQRLRVQRSWFPQLCSGPLREAMVVVCECVCVGG